MSVLLIEDTEAMFREINAGLTHEGYEVHIATTGSEGERLGRSDQYEAIILDWTLPDIEGVDVCRNLRRSGVKTPIIMLTAMHGTNNKVSGLDAGADDYMTKPFELAELLARLRALSRRGMDTILRFEDVELDLLGRKVKRAGREIRLTQKEFALLEFFVRHPNEILTRNVISQKVWEENFDNESNVIDVFISMLRRKFDSGFPTKYIHTVVTKGYMLSAERTSGAS
jgi:DNA-binding response OmpR family regulator